MHSRLSNIKISTEIFYMKSFEVTLNPSFSSLTESTVMTQVPTLYKRDPFTQRGESVCIRKLGTCSLEIKSTCWTSSWARYERELGRAWRGVLWLKFSFPGSNVIISGSRMSPLSWGWMPVRKCHIPYGDWVSHPLLCTADLCPWWAVPELWATELSLGHV